MEKIEETKSEIVKIKSRFNCPNCGYAFKNDALFCSKCGTKLPEREEPEEKLPKNAKKCTNCGKVLPKEAIYCKECGTKLDTQVITITAEEKEVSSEEFAPVKNENVVDLTKTTEVTEIAEKEEAVVEETVSAEKSEEKNDEQAVEVINETVTVEVVEKTEESEPANSSDTNNSVELSFEKICPNCKNKIEDGDLFCNECGTKIE